MKNILIVDDEIDILETIVDSLEVEFEDRDLNISSTINPNEALRTFVKENNFDLVVTDLKMPSMNGLELAKKIKAFKEETPIIVFTGHGDTREFAQLSSIGVKEMVKKPNIRELISLIQNRIKL